MDYTGILSWNGIRMETRHFRYVETVVAQGSFSAAARVLGITQPALTKIVARLEDELKAPLFDRKPRGVELTLYGQRFLAASRLLSRELDELGSDIDALKAGIRGAVQIGAGQWWVDGILPVALAEMGDRFPEVTVRASTGARTLLVEQLRDGHFDFILAAITGSEGVDLKCEILVEAVLVPVVRKGHSLASCEGPLSAESLASFPWALPYRDDPAHIHLVAAFRRAGCPFPRTSLTASSNHLIARLVSESDTVAFLPQLTHSSYGRELTTLNAPWCTFHRRAGLISAAVRPMDPAAAALAACVRSLVRQAPQ